MHASACSSASIRCRGPMAAAAAAASGCRSWRRSPACMAGARNCRNAKAAAASPWCRCRANRCAGGAWGRTRAGHGWPAPARSVLDDWTERRVLPHVPAALPGTDFIHASPARHRRHRWRAHALAILDMEHGDGRQGSRTARQRRARAMNGLRLGLKAAVVLALTLAILIPLLMIRGTIQERQQYRAAAVRDIGASFG